MALAVFHNEGGHWLDWFLKDGFKHVFCVVSQGDYWISIDGRAGLPVVEVVAASSYDLKTFYEAEGYTVVEVEEGLATILPLSLSNCVGMVMSILGIQAISVVTPYQLFKHLRDSNV